AGRPANAPAGLCPSCLLRLAFDDVPGADPEEEAEDPGRSSRWATGGSPATPPGSGILPSLDASVGPGPRVLLRDGTPGVARPVRPRPEGLPALAGEAGRYHLFGEIARGGMGVVLKGRDVDLGRDVAVKVLRERYRDCPEMVRRFIEEAQIGG